ncbi:Uncharacterised protein [Mycobacteroides abscessus subsp. abscessus]|nr:Uncharacterised protein [Mycobacteroides abscessus subsp. abscessus]
MHARTLAGEVVLVSLPRRTVVAGFGVEALAAAVGARPVSALASSAQIDHAGLMQDSVTGSVTRPDWPVGS